MTTALPAERTAIVTGAASERGIGRAVAERLAREGWAVAALDIDGEQAALTAKSLSHRYDVPCLGLAVDVADEDQVARAVDQTSRALPPIIGLANVAGVSSPTPFLELHPAEWDRVFAINARGTYLVTRAVVPGLVDRRLGRIVNIASASAQRGGGTYSKVAYSAAKAAVLGLTRALAREVGKHGVTVNAVSPGPIDTDIMGGRLDEARKAELVRELLVDRVGTVNDVAAVVAFLLGPDAGYITGTTYNVNGGLIVD